MTKLLSEAIEAVQKLPDVLQDEVAALMMEAVGKDAGELALTPEQWAEVEAAIEEDDFLSEEETAAFFARLRA